ncbi:MAG: single-stranded DNA-binding protein [Eubacteriaceae bacterium]|nr:single-stranded DNA-binding protein [Eubacteriaceae bacterium]
MLNVAILEGRLTKDPELRPTANGISMTTFTMAVDRSYKNRNGERETDFLLIKTWRGTADLCARYLHKGNLVSVRGRIETRSYDGNDGVRRYVTEIVADEVNFLTPRSEQQQQAPPVHDYSDSFGVPMDGFEEIDDMEIPF